MRKWLITACLKSVCAFVFFCLFYSFRGTELQLPIVGAILITAVYFDADNWEIK